MARTLSPNVVAEKDKQENRPIELYQIYLDQQTLYFAAYPEDIQYYDENGLPVTYYSLGLSRSPVRTNIDTKVDEVTVQLDNVTRLMSSYIANTEFVGRRLKIIKIFRREPTPVIENLASGTLTNINVIDGVLKIKGPQFARNSVAYLSDGTQVASGVPRFEAGKFGQAVMVEEGTTNVLPYPLTQEYYGGSLRAVGSYYTTSGFKIIATGQPLGGPIPGCRLNITGGQFTVKGKTSVDDYILIYWRGFDSVGNTVITQTSTNASVVNNWFEKTVNLGTVSGLTYIHVGVGRPNLSDYWIEYTRVEAKPYSTSFIDGTRSPETLTVPTEGVFNKGNWTVEFWFEPTSNPEVVQGVLWLVFIDASNYYCLYKGADGRPLLFVISGGIIYQAGPGTAPVMAIGTKYHLAIRGNGSTINLLVNGLPVGADVSYVEPVGFLPANMCIGWNSQVNEPSNGLYDDLRISKRARTDEEILAAYNSGAPLPIDEDTIAKLDFDGSLKLIGNNWGQRVSQIYDLSPYGIASNTEITYVKDELDGKAIIETSLSKDGGSTWSDYVKVVSGQAIPGINRGDSLVNHRLRIRQTLSCEDSSLSPAVSESAFSIESQGNIYSGFEDHVVIFDGIMDEPVITETAMRVTVLSKLDILGLGVPRRRYQRLCNWKFGSVECGASLGIVTGTVTGISADKLTLTLSDRTEPADYYKDGVLTIGSERQRVLTSSGATFVVDYPFVNVQVGDTYSLRRGCDKTFETCRDRFGNQARFGGFLSIPAERTVRR